MCGLKEWKLTALNDCQFELAKTLFLRTMVKTDQATAFLYFSAGKLLSNDGVLLLFLRAPNQPPHRIEIRIF